MELLGNLYDPLHCSLMIFVCYVYLGHGVVMEYLRFIALFSDDFCML